MAPRKKKPDSKKAASTPRKKAKKKPRPNRGHREQQPSYYSDINLPPLNYYTDEVIIAGVRQAKGLISVAAGLIGCNTLTIYKRIKSSPDVAEAVKEARNKQVDIAEDKLWKAVDKEAPWAIAMVLKGPGKDRGYVDRVQQRIGGDEEAPPVKQEKYVFTIDDFPLDFRLQLLEQMRRLKAKQGDSSDAPAQASPPDQPTQPASAAEPGLPGPAE